MLIRINNEFWIDFDDVRVIFPDKEGGLQIYYRNSVDATYLPRELKDEFLSACSNYTGFPLY